LQADLVGFFFWVEKSRWQLIKSRWQLIKKLLQCAQDARRKLSIGYGPQPCPHWAKKDLETAFLFCTLS